MTTDFEVTLAEQVKGEEKTKRMRWKQRIGKQIKTEKARQRDSERKGESKNLNARVYGESSGMLQACLKVLLLTTQPVMLQQNQSPQHTHKNFA